MQATADTAASVTAAAASAPVLLMLHSSGAGAAQWRRWTELLPHMRLHAPDLLGYAAHAPWPAQSRLHLDDEAERLARWLLVQPRPVHVLGHSYGGAVALQLALRWPGRVARLTLYEPVRFSLLRAAGDDNWAEIVRVGEGICELQEAGEADAAARRFVDYWSARGSWDAMPAARQAALRERMPKVCAEFRALFDDALPLSAYTQLRMPVALLHGTRSPAPALAVARALARLLPECSVEALDGLGHMGPLEDAARVAQRLAVSPEVATVPA